MARIRLRHLWLAAATAVAMLGVGCGGGAATQPLSTGAGEHAERPAKLAPGWSLEVNPAGGFSAGVPPGWSSKQQGSSSLLSAPDHLIAVSIAADRTDEALKTPLPTFASEAMAHLPGFANLHPDSPKPFRAHYPAVSVQSTGTRAEGLKERLRLIVMKPDSLAVFSVLAATTARIPRGKETKIVERVARTVRHRPVEVAP